jgi:hypothetical protein
MQDPIVQEPISQEPAAQEPIVQEPEAKEPEIQEPVVEEPAVSEKEHIPADAIDSEEILKLIDTPHVAEPEEKPEEPRETDDIIIERMGTPEPPSPETPREPEVPPATEPVQERIDEPPSQEKSAVEAEETQGTVTPSEDAATPQETTAEQPQKPAKPKEEDFQSFKDWLSGLLK